jgi:hypothetical protein
MIFVRELKHFNLNPASSTKQQQQSQKEIINLEDNLTVLGTFKLIWNIVKIKPMIYLIFILLTFRVRSDHPDPDMAAYKFDLFLFF